MHLVPLTVQCIYGWSIEGGEDGGGKERMSFLENGREWIFLGLLYADDLFL